MRSAALIALVAVVLGGLAACGSSSDSPTTDAGTTASRSAATAAETPEQAAKGGWATLKRLAAPNASKLIIPQGPSPDQVVIRDLKIGSGAAIEPGDVFTSQYISFDYENEAVVEPTPEPGKESEPTWVEAGRLIWGTGERVQGWEPGLKGIRAGGIRELIVPSRLAYENGVRVYLIKVSEIDSE